MSERKIATRITATENRTEPLWGSVAVGGSATEKVWCWGDDNMLPYALSIISTE